MAVVVGTTALMSAGEEEASRLDFSQRDNTTLITTPTDCHFKLIEAGMRSETGMRALVSVNGLKRIHARRASNVAIMQLKYIEDLLVLCKN